MAFKSSAVKSQNPPIKPSTTLTLMNLNSLYGLKRKEKTLFFEVLNKLL